jgi:nicotinate-nucleotide adenylyltransferase
MMKFHAWSQQKPQKLGVLAGSFNPPTVAHEGLVSAAGSYVDGVLCVVPTALPHKEYFGATLEQRLEMLQESQISSLSSIASSDAGLFVDMARECKEHYGSNVQLYFICGRDAAERVLSWDYGRPGVVEEMLREFHLLVAARQGEFEAPPELDGRIHRMHMRRDHDLVSSTEVRKRIARGEPWEHLVPTEIVELVRQIYSGGAYS